MDKSLSPERRTYLRHILREKRAVTALRVLILTAFFALWELSARLGVVDAFIMSSPSRMW